MGKGYIVRRGGGGEQVTKPIFNSVVSAGFTSITVNIENDDNSEAILYYSVVNADPVPNQANTFSVTLAGRTADDVTITGLTANSSYVLYIKAFALGKFPSDIVIVTGQLQTNSPIVATGGTITTYSSGGTDYKVHTFLSNGTFAVTNASISPYNQLEFLIVGGGGAGGGRYMGGGGGAGGYLSSVTGELSGGNSAALPKVAATVANHSVVVGGGGTGRSDGIRGDQGISSSALGYTALGGSGGGSWDQSQKAAGSNGGSGGGHSGYLASTPSNGTAGQGFRGAAGQIYGGGGGGGAGAVGNAGNSGEGGTGGIGRQSAIRNGSLVYYAGGGGGGDYTGTGTNAGGLGGGGFGAAGPSNSSGGNPGPGTANTGGGGGGCNGYNDTTAGRTSGAGGSGIVIIRYVVGGTV